MLKPYRCWLSASSTSSTVVRRQANLLAAQPAALAFLLKYDDHRSCQPSWTPALVLELQSTVHVGVERASWAALRSDRTASGPKCKLSQSSVNPKRKRDPLRAGQGHSRCRIHVPRMPTHSSRQASIVVSAGPRRFVRRKTCKTRQERRPTPSRGRRSSSRPSSSRAPWPPAAAARRRGRSA